MFQGWPLVMRLGHYGDSLRFMLLYTALCHLLCRSLGLTLLEAVTGRYPYDASVGPLQLMIQVRCSPSLSLSATCQGVLR